jgi:acetoin utilization deacetylase AcuC-like enzyme
LAVAATEALRGRANSVAIIDIDAHHGNGTEDIFNEDPRVFTLSIHQAPPFFPGTGGADENGRGRGRGHNLNLPVAPDEDWLGALELGLSHVQRQRPQLILVEFSTDAHRADPVSDLQLSDQDFEDAVHMIESLGAPTVYELGASLSERAWVGGVRALVVAASTHR